MRLDDATLREREALAQEQYRACRLCPRFCEVDRTRGATGPCAIDDGVHLGGWGVHFGEEPQLTGRGGCGLVLLAACNLACRGCETHGFSRELKGVRRATVAELAGIVLELQRRGAETVQFVTPTHQLPAIVSALRRARAHGFDRPIVWNCGGYESVEALRLLDGIVDVYLPDLKHGTDDEGKLTGVPDYWTRAQDAIREMHRQVGDLDDRPSGVSTRGLLVRHLVLPDDAARSESVVRFLADLAPATGLNVMGQYQPVFQLVGHSRLGRRVTGDEVRRVLDRARELGLTRAFAHR